MITNIPDRERDLQAQVDALTEELASVEASNRIRGDELVRLRDEMSKMQQHAAPPADIISRAVANAKYWMDRAEHAEAELERLRAQKPVAWMDDFGNAFPLAANKGAGSWMDEHKRHWKPLYRAAPPAQPADIGNTISSKTPEPNEENPYVLWREIHRLRTEVQGPSGFATWQDAAVAERVRRVKAEQELRAAQPAPAQEPQPVSNTDELPQRLSDERIMHFWDIHAGMPTEKYPLNYKDVRAFARAIEAAIVPQWMPIESAPKDELILVGPTKRMGICVAMHHSRDGWVTETTSEWMTMYTPTHWMPLPAAPKAAP